VVKSNRAGRGFHRLAVFLAAIPLVIGAAMLVSGCVGGSEDYWLEQRRLSSEWSRVARIFGYSNNQEGCNDIAEAMQSRVETAPIPAQFRCVPAHKWSL
jgi:hypothetical protein